MKRTMINKMGLLGVISLISYGAAVFFAPLAYPGYDSFSQAVSDLSASNSPSRLLWGQLSSLYEICGMISIMTVCLFIQGKLTRILRTGIYLFTVMNWLSSVGYAMFPLSESGYAGAFQDLMHMVVTVLVVLLSIVSLIVIIVGGCKEKKYRSLAVWAAIALAMMFIGSVGSGAVPPQYFGILQRISLFAAVGFNAVLGVYLFNGFGVQEDTQV